MSAIASTSSYAGGICGVIGIKTLGKSGGSISNCYNMGGVSAAASQDMVGPEDSRAGGICGAGDGNISNCYNVATVSASASRGLYLYAGSTAYAGGIRGDGPGADSNCYWDTNSVQTVNGSPQTPSKGVGNGMDTTMPLTTAQMKTASNFIGFDFNTVWAINASINNGYPYLSSFTPQSYTIILTPYTNKTFTAVTEDYTQPAAYPVKVKNIGNAANESVAVVLSGVNKLDFTLNRTSLDKLEAGKETSFTVRPNANLKVGTYTATVTVTGTGEGNSKSFTVSFTVKAKTTAKITFIDGKKTIQSTDQKTGTNIKLQPRPQRKVKSSRGGTPKRPVAVKSAQRYRTRHGILCQMGRQQG